MNSIVFRADVISPSVPLHPFGRELPCILSSPEPVGPGSAELNRPPIRHLLIGVPEVVQLTIHRLHQVGYAEAGLWSTAIGLSSPKLTLGDFLKRIYQVGAHGHAPLQKILCQLGNLFPRNLLNGESGGSDACVEAIALI